MRNTLFRCGPEPLHCSMRGFIALPWMNAGGIGKRTLEAWWAHSGISEYMLSNRAPCHLWLPALLCDCYSCDLARHVCLWCCHLSYIRSKLSNHYCRPALAQKLFLTPGCRGRSLWDPRQQRGSQGRASSAYLPHSSLCIREVRWHVEIPACGQ